MFEAVTIGGKDILLRYSAGSIMAIEKNAGKRVGPAGLKFISQKSGIEFSERDKIPIEMVMGFMDLDLETMLWVWGYGLDWPKSGGKPGDAQELYDQYMAEGDPDDGERFRNFKQMAINAINASRGIDTKKLIEKNTAEQEKAIAEKEKTRLREAAIKAQARKEYEAGIGSKQPDSASEN